MGTADSGKLQDPEQVGTKAAAGLLWRAFLFAIPVLVALAVLEVECRRIPNDYSLKRAVWANGLPGMRGVVLGSSHAYYGIDPDRLSVPVFNASHPAQSIDLDRMMLERLGADIDSLDLVILPIVYSSFHLRMQDIEHVRWRLKNYSIYYDFPVGHFPLDRSEIVHGRFVEHLDRVRLYHLNGRTDVYCRPNGFGWRSPTEKGDLVRTAEKALQGQRAPDLSDTAGNVAHLRAIIRMTKKKGGRLVLLSVPCHPLYNNNMVPEQWAMVQDIIRSVVDDCTVFYFDHHDDPAFKDEHFMDADHLNGDGAELYSTMLDSLLRTKVGVVP